MAGPVTTTTLASAIKELFMGPFESLRDESNTFLSRVPKTEADKKTYDWHIEDMAYTMLWSAAESDQLTFLSASVVANDGVGSATAFIAPNTHPLISASVTLRMNYFGIEMSGLAKAALSGPPAAYVKVLKYETEKAMKDFWRNMNLTALSTLTASTAGNRTAGGNNNGKDIDGLGIIFNVAGGNSYAGLSTSTYPAWNPANDTTTTQVSIAALQALINKIEGGTETLGTDTIRDGTVKEIWTGPTQFDNYGNLLTGLRRYDQAETLDGGVKKIEFEGHNILKIPRFPSGWLIMDCGNLYFAVLKELDTDDKSATIVDGTLIVGSHYSNLVLRDRKREGVMNALT